MFTGVEENNISSVLSCGGVSMAEIKHLVLAKFKEGVVVEDIIRGMEKMISGIDAVKSFEWGQDEEGQEMLRQGLTHAFLFTFSNKDDFMAYLTHPSHVEYSATFSSTIENVVLLDFPAVLVKPNKKIVDQAEEPVKPVEKEPVKVVEELEKPVEEPVKVVEELEKPVEDKLIKPVEAAA